MFMTLSTLLNPVEAVFILRRVGGGWGVGGLTVGGGGISVSLYCFIEFCVHSVSPTRDVTI
jgi:hypothetical protein